MNIKVNEICMYRARGEIANFGGGGGGDVIFLSSFLRFSYLYCNRGATAPHASGGVGNPSRVIKGERNACWLFFLTATSTPQISNQTF